jgi:hypothetical protein
MPQGVGPSQRAYVSPTSASARSTKAAERYNPCCAMPSSNGHNARTRPERVEEKRHAELVSPLQRAFREPRIRPSPEHRAPSHHDLEDFFRRDRHGGRAVSHKKA